MLMAQRRGVIEPACTYCGANQPVVYLWGAKGALANTAIIVIPTEVTRAGSVILVAH